MQGKGKCPLPLQPIPKTNNKTKINNKTKTNNKTKVVYTEDWTHPQSGSFYLAKNRNFLLGLDRRDWSLRTLSRH